MNEINDVSQVLTGEPPQMIAWAVAVTRDWYRGELGFDLEERLERPGRLCG